MKTYTLYAVNRHGMPIVKRTIDGGLRPALLEFLLELDRLEHFRQPVGVVEIALYDDERNKMIASSEWGKQ